MSVPAVSVIVPTYNRAGVVPRALRSVLAQSAGDLELLVIDDGSTDDTEQCVRTLDDPRIRYVKQPTNRGVAAARNRGLALARGALIAFLDSDDEWYPDKLARQAALFRRADARLGLVYTGVESIDTFGRASVQRPCQRGNVHAAMLVRNVLHGGGSNVMIRRQVVQHVGLMDESLPAIEDHDYWLRVTRHYLVDFVADPLIRYHDPAGGHSARLERRSLDRPGNVAAREQFFAMHADEMRRAGVAHRYLLDSARRHRRAGHITLARACVRQALQEKWSCAEAHLLLAFLHCPSAAQHAAQAAWRLADTASASLLPGKPRR